MAGVVSRNADRVSNQILRHVNGLHQSANPHKFFRLGRVYSNDVPTALHNREQQAGIDTFPVQENSTGTALSMVAPLRRRSDVEAQSQRIKQSGPWFNC